MAELNDFINNLEKELTCSICDEIYSEPKTLQCLHSFCRKCIEKWIEMCKNRGQRLTCPTCRSREDADISRLRPSFYLDSLKQLLLSMKNNTSKPEVDKEGIPNCVSCQEHQKLVAFCQQCQGMICTDCVNAHKKIKQLRNHQVIMFIDFKQEHVNSYINNQVHCKEKFHTDQKLEYFCQTCHKCICAKCSNTTHGKHDKLSIEEKADEKKRDINNSVHRVNQQRQRFVQELEQSKQNMTRIENQIETTKKQVSDHVEAQIKIFKDHENAMTKVLDEILDQQKSSNEEEQNEINAVIQQFDAVNEQHNTLQQQSVDYMILQSQLRQRCQELLQRPSVLSSKPIQRNTRVYYTPNSQVNQSLQDIGNITKSVIDPTKCTIEGQNEVRCGFVNTFEIVTRSSKGDVCHTEEGLINILIQDVDGKEVEYKLVKNQPGKYLVSYKAEKPSPYRINVSIAGHTIRNSPIKVRTIDAKADFKFVKIIEQKEDIKFPYSLAVNNSHQAVIADLEGHCIVIFSMDGKCLRKVGTEGTRDGELLSPLGVLTYEDKILVSDYPGVGRIQEFHVNGTYLRTIYRQQGVTVSTMCIAGDNISVLSYWKIGDKCQMAIKLFSKHSGQFARDIPTSTAAYDIYECPSFIAYGDSKYFLSYTCKNYISVHDDNGVFLYKFGDKGNQNGQFVTGLAVYGEDMLLVCDWKNHRVQVFTQDGHFITSFGSSGQGQVNGPYDVTVTPDGKVFVLVSDGKRVQMWK